VFTSFFNVTFFFSVHFIILFIISRSVCVKFVFHFTPRSVNLTEMSKHEKYSKEMVSFDSFTYMYVCRMNE